MHTLEPRERRSRDANKLRRGRRKCRTHWWREAWAETLPDVEVACDRVRPVLGRAGAGFVVGGMPVAHYGGGEAAGGTHAGHHFELDVAEDIFEVGDAGIEVPAIDGSGGVSLRRGEGEEIT